MKDKDNKRSFLQTFCLCLQEKITLESTTNKDCMCKNENSHLNMRSKPIIKLHKASHYQATFQGGTSVAALRDKTKKL